ncbi:MAG: hypothetical protein Q9160_003622 [Pyrenula sp. 1 TL-2023]
MYSAARPVSSSLNGMGSDLIDGSGTINPAALNSAAALQASSIPTSGTSPRGVKRSRSPEQYGDLPVGVDGDDEEAKRRRRGRPPKSQRLSGDLSGLPTPNSAPSAPQPQVAPPAQTPQVKHENLPPANITPTRNSPPQKPTPTKSQVKALPTVRDHTSDQLNNEGDEYIPREFDEAGEKKVDAMGNLHGDRHYRCRTFTVPGRGEKLFMLATECARVLTYRDSYLLFNKNRSLYKIIATQAEKDHLIAHDFLPYSYRSRQIAIVTARSMFRQFGSRVIEGGMRVRDDYWESKARKQGFTEEDPAGEKRPGAAKAREAAQAEAAQNQGLNLAHNDIVYTNGPPIEGMAHTIMQPGMSTSLAPLPMIIPPSDDPRLRDYSNIPRPRQEIAGAPYQDRTQSSTNTEIMNQASHTADFNRALNQQRSYRSKGLEEYWNKPHEQPVTSPPQQHSDQPASQAFQSPQPAQSEIPTSQQPQLQGQLQPGMSQHPQTGQQSSFSNPPHQQNPLAQSPIRSMPSQSMRPDPSQSFQQHGRPGLSSTPQPPPYGYPPQHQHPSQPQMWGAPPPQPSPLSAQHRMTPQYSPRLQHTPTGSHSSHQGVPSPVPQHHPQHPSQSPHPPPQQIPQPPHMLHQQTSSSLPSGMYGSVMPSGGPSGYMNMGMGTGMRGTSMYQNPQHSPAPQQAAQFMPPSSVGQGMQSWPAASQASTPWPGY